MPNGRDTGADSSRAPTLCGSNHRPRVRERRHSAEQATMPANDNPDGPREKEREMAANPEARGTRDEQHGAIHGKHSTEQMNSWEITKIDLKSEHRIEREMIAEKDEPPAPSADEAEHGDAGQPV